MSGQTSLCQIRSDSGTFTQKPRSESIFSENPSGKLDLTGKDSSGDHMQMTLATLTEWTFPLVFFYDLSLSISYLCLLHEFQVIKCENVYCGHFQIETVKG